jgi:hypothetical protein
MAVSSGNDDDETPPVASFDDDSVAASAVDDVDLQGCSCCKDDYNDDEDAEEEDEHDAEVDVDDDDEPPNTIDFFAGCLKNCFETLAAALRRSLRSLPKKDGSKCSSMTNTHGSKSFGTTSSLVFVSVTMSKIHGMISNTHFTLFHSVTITADVSIFLSERKRFD